MIIFGTRRTVTQLAIVVLVCGFCRRQAAQSVLEAVTKFTLFFIPLFPVRKRYLVQCTACGGAADITAEQAAQYRSAPPAPAPPPYPGQPGPGHLHPGQPYPGHPGPGARSS